ncbi:MAG: hypothetical protein LUE27_04500 [Clostridia bacterium]|nr:hypothetical protein [Clostridia bacterium]
MAYIKRHIEETLLEAAGAGSGITLCGPHLAGKRTTLEHLFPGREILPAEGYTDALRISGTNPDAEPRTFHLLGLSMRELAGDDFREPFMPTVEYLEKRMPRISLDMRKAEDCFWLMNSVFRGRLPLLFCDEKYSKVKAEDFRVDDFVDGICAFWNDYIAGYRDTLAETGVPAGQYAYYIQ